MGLWIYYHRRSDLWLLLSVTALVTRLWTYHGIYDDLLILLPMVALFRIAKQSSAADDDAVLAGVLLAITTLAMMAPTRMWHSPPPWSWFFTAGHTIVWIVLLIFLVERARHDKCRSVSA